MYFFNTTLLNSIMKKSTNILVGGLFLLAVVLTAGLVFDCIGLDFGLTQLFGSVFAGLVGAFKLTAGS